ncbi:protein TolQ [Aestuariispira ectoiniformans]|uniref:protein TolQ n=1 Tax=Aestuariispira ectoiniformans TaxID=2775080 RepID=UPI0021E40F01|nr:protein TolQ [Aestuariispira ectoiniformans]
MEQAAMDTVSLAGAMEVHELSIMGLFWQADWIVKLVMIALVLASVWCWAIIIEKLMKLRKLRRLANRFEDAFWSGGSLDDLYERVGQYPADPMSSVFSSAMREWRRSASRGLNGSSGVSLNERIERVMQVTLSREMDQLERYLPFLASVGSSAPFVGLFGTVWGIMNSFASIAATKQTSLAVVAPGIAEALFATALGLVAAIPATIAYNKISTDLGRFGNRLESFSQEFSSIISRQLDEG